MSDDDDRSVEEHLRALQRHPDDQQETRRVPLAEATVDDHYQAIRSRKQYGPDAVILTDDDTPDRKRLTDDLPTR